MKVRKWEEEIWERRGFVGLGRDGFGVCFFMFLFLFSCVWRVCGRWLGL